LQGHHRLGTRESSPSRRVACGRRTDPPTTCGDGALNDDNEETRAGSRRAKDPSGGRTIATVRPGEGDPPLRSPSTLAFQRRRPVGQRLDSPLLSQVDRGARSDAAPRRATPSRTPGCFPLLGTPRTTVARPARAIDTAMTPPPPTMERTTLQATISAPLSPTASAWH